MLSFRKLAIFCILAASVQMVICKKDPMTDQDRELYKQLVESFGNIVRNENSLKYVTVAYKSTNLLHKLSNDDFQLNCVNAWRNFVHTFRMENKELELEFDPKSPTDVVNQLIYKAFDTVITKIVIGFEEIIKLRYSIVGWQFYGMLQDGNILEFLHFREKFSNENKNKIKNEMKNVMKKYKKRGMEDGEARLWVILHNYDWGILGNRYPGEKPSNPPKRSGDYEPIEQRFDNFKDLLEKVDGNEKLSTYTCKYERGLWDKLEHDFKLRCLMVLRSAHVKKITMNDAHRVFDEACKNYFREIRDTIGARDEKLIWQFELMLKQGNIIYLSVFNNNLNLSDEKKEAEFKLLKEDYPNMKDEEMELWVTIHNYDWGILGNRYPGKKPNNPPKRQGPYVTIQKRFEHFKDLVKGVDETKRWPDNTKKYNEIERLDDVVNDFKLRCLKQFEKRLYSDEEHLQPADFKEDIEAYKILDEVCKDYFRIIKSKISSSLHWIAINDSLNSKLGAENIIQFLVHKNNPGIAEEKKKDEINRLMKVFKVRNMTKEEAELWVILRLHYNEIIGEYYPPCPAGWMKKKPVLPIGGI